MGDDMKQVFIRKKFIDIVPVGANYTQANPYWIPRDRLSENWVEHLRGKSWWTPELEAEFTDALLKLSLP
jgi:hypothetical protein